MDRKKTQKKKKQVAQTGNGHSPDSNLEFFGRQRQVKSFILLEFKFVQEFMPVLVTCKFHKITIKIVYVPDIDIFGPEGQKPLKLKVRSGINLNPSKIVCLSWSSASFIKIQSKINMLCPRHQIWTFFWHSRNSEVKSHNLTLSKILCLSWLSVSFI